MDVQPLSAILGIEVSGFDARHALEKGSAEPFASLQLLLETHRLIRIRGLDLSPREFVTLASRFGPVASLRRARREGLHIPEFPQIKVVSNGGRGDHKVGDGDAAENAWHTDGSYLMNPTALTFLYGRRAPASPPRTIFMDMSVAYQQLPSDLRERIAGRRAVHYSPFNFDAADLAALETLREPADRKSIGRWRPLVVRHPISGLPSLMPPRQSQCVIEGLSEHQSEELATELWEFIATRDCVWGEAILPGDLLFWDNQFSLHMREAFSGDSERTLWHTTTQGASYLAYEQGRSA